MAADNLIKPYLAPLKIPEKVELVGTNLTFPTAPTEWMYFVLVPVIPDGNTSPLVSKVGSIDSRKIPGSSNAFGNLLDLVSEVIFPQSSLCLSLADVARYSYEEKYEFGLVLRS